MERICAAAEGFEEGLIAAAVEQACLRCADSPVDYILTLLSDWRKQRIQTLDDLGRYSYLRDARSGKISGADPFAAEAELKVFSARAAPA